MVLGAFRFDESVVPPHGGGSLAPQAVMQHAAAAVAMMEARDFLAFVMDFPPVAMSYLCGIPHVV